jgi:hypothetical protein
MNFCFCFRDPQQKNTPANFLGRRKFTHMKGIFSCFLFLFRSLRREFISLFKYYIRFREKLQELGDMRALKFTPSKIIGRDVARAAEKSRARLCQEHHLPFGFHLR